MNEESFRFSPKIQPELEFKNNITLNKIIKVVIYLAAIFLIVFVSLYLYITNLNKPANNFPINEPIIIERGMDMKNITETLERENVVKSATLLYYILILFNEPSQIKASTYVFDKTFTTLEIAKRLNEGDFDADLVKFTHFEGERATQLALRASTVLPNFDIETFISKATPLEGTLFPDTYFIPIDYSEQELLELMTNTFTEKTSALDAKIAQHTLSLSEILVLASIIEREANTNESMKLVSGILQNRLTIGMPLQADASIEYILNKPLSELTPEDLETESPYNTYLYTGLPPTPIGNPGLDAIEAVLEPTESEYLYYITDEEGNFYYSKTYKEHLQNIERYLR